MTQNINTELLIQFIKKHTKADDIQINGIKKLTGGAIQENFGLDLNIVGGNMSGTQKFVARCNAPATLSVSLSRKQEFEVLQAAFAAGLIVPEPFWYSDDISIMGSEFYIMRWANGSAVPKNIIKGENITAAKRKSLTYSLGQNLAKLHKIKYSPDTLSFLPKPKNTAALHRVQEYRDTLDNLNELHPAIELMLSYLEQYAPDDDTLVLSHCDFRTGNYMVEDSKLTAVLDWEFATWSHPYEDLGWLCNRSWRFGNTEFEVGGLGDKSDLFAGYESIAATKVNEQLVLYWELMASVRWAVIALGQSHRHLSGQDKSLELALTGRMLPEIQKDGLIHLKDLMAVIDSNTQLNMDTADTNVSQNTSSSEYADITDRPDASNLLDQVCSVLKTDLLPSLPKEQIYNALMSINAINIANREISFGAYIKDKQQNSISQFYKNKQHVSYEKLALDIRNQSIPDNTAAATFELVNQLLTYKLQLSNPKRVAS